MGSNGQSGALDPRGVEELRDSERRYRTVIEQSPLSIHVFAPNGRSLLANSSWNELWNLREGEEPEGTSIFEDEQIRATGLLPYIEKGINEGSSARRRCYTIRQGRGGRGNAAGSRPSCTRSRVREGTCAR